MASEDKKADEAAAKKCSDIHQAAENGDVPALRHLLRVDPESVHEQNIHGQTPLHLAAWNGHVAAAELLLSKGAAVDAEGDFGQTPLHLAAYNGQVAAAEFLLSKGAAVDAKDNGGETPLHDAADKGHVAAAELLLSKGAAVDAKDNGGWTPLHVAALHGHVEAAELLLSKGAAMNAKGNCGETPLHVAALHGHVAAAELLLSKGAAMNAKDNCGETPLHRAAFFGKVAAAEFLLSKGAAVDAKDNNGKTPLDLAREESETKVEQLLLNPPAKKPSADDGKTPPDLSNKGKAEKEPLPTAADKTSEAQETSVFPVSSPRRQTSKEDAAPHAAGSGAVAVKHQREASKDEDAAHAAGSGAVAVKHQRESSKEAVVQAAKELQVAMDSGNAQVLKNAIDNAKLHKVSQEDIMKALEKYIALQEAANQSATSPVKEATTSKAESSVKLEPGHGARLAMFSARFNEKNKETETKFRAVHQLLVESQYEVLMVEAGEGKSFGEMTAQYLGRLKRENGIMLAVCTSDYGEMTASPFCTYFELKSAVEYKIDVLPLQVEDIRQPNPPCGKGHLDEHQKALGFIDLVFTPSTVQLDCRNKSVEEIATKIAAVLREPL